MKKMSKKLHDLKKFITQIRNKEAAPIPPPVCGRHCGGEKAAMIGTPFAYKYYC